jgi:hypothetical protein
MAGLVPAIHVLARKNVDARHEAGHDDGAGTKRIIAALRRAEVTPFFERLGPAMTTAMPGHGT